VAHWGIGGWLKRHLVQRLAAMAAENYFFKKYKKYKFCRKTL
jgi:hypothetical protein